MSIDVNKLICGDCLEVMETFPDSSIDAIITDPPYGISFLSKHWDYDVPKVEVFKEMLRIAKPGATLLCFGGSRTFHRVAVNIEDAGWELKDTIMWLYGSGMPKSQSVSKLIDKKLGKSGERKIIDYLSNAYPDSGNWGNSNSVNVGGMSQKSNLFKGGKDKLGRTPIETSATKEALLFEGYCTHSLKPAFEPIIMAIKPNAGSYADNALKYGIAGLNIEATRIPFGENDDERIGKDYSHNAKAGLEIGDHKDNSSGEELLLHNPKGRYPANVLLDKEAGKMLDSQGDIFGKLSINSYGGSRFFYCTKASSKERVIMENMRNDHPTVKPLDLMRYLCKLVKQPNKTIVLDPYAGSGTTGVAIKNLDMDYILIEKEEVYCNLINARLQGVPVLNDLVRDLLFSKIGLDKESDQLYLF